MEVSLMDRQCGIDGGTAAMDDGGARKCQMDQPGPEEIEGHLVGHPGCVRRDRAQHGDVVSRRPGEKRLRDPGRPGAMPLRAAFVPEVQLSAGPDLWMHGDNLLDQGCAGPR